MGRLTVEVLLPDIGLLALAQATQRRRHGPGSRDTTGPEEGADVCTRDKDKHETLSGGNRVKAAGGNQHFFRCSMETI